MASQQELDEKLARIREHNRTLPPIQAEYDKYISIEPLGNSPARSIPLKEWTAAAAAMEAWWDTHHRLWAEFYALRDG